MGMYTELALGVRFKASTPEDIISELDQMTKGEGTMGGRLRWCLRSGGSAYFEAEPVLRWDPPKKNARHEFERQAALTVWTNIKNYENEWQTFLEFISPWVEGPGWSPQHVGHIRYEETQFPTLIFVDYTGLLVWSGGGFMPISSLREGSY